MVLTGLDRLERGLRHEALRGRCALLTNQSGVSRSFASTAEILSGHEDLEPALLFAPEHGLHGEAQDQVLCEERHDPLTGLPVVSLYGALRKPSVEHLAGIDVVIADIQDVGSRYYTFVYSMAYVMEAAAEAGVPVAILDRPNPIGGERVEGNVVRDGFFSFVGLYPLSTRHGMTAGELGLYFSRNCSVGADPRVITLEGWKRDLYWDNTGLDWIPPSPNMPALETALVYPGTCLLEGTNVSEGRGTTRPFETVGAPFIDPKILTLALSEFELPGVAFRPIFFEPTFHKWQGKRCGGVWIHVVDRHTFRPFLTGIALLKAVRDRYRDDFAWRKPPYEYEEHLMPIDMLAGSDTVRILLEQDESLSHIEESWREELEEFIRSREGCLLYD